MKRSRFSEEQVIGILKEQESGSATADVCRRHGISSATFYKWKAKFGGLEISDARRLRALEEENVRLKRLLADAMLDNAILKDVAGKMVCPLNLLSVLFMERRTCLWDEDRQRRRPSHAMLGPSWRRAG